MAPADPPDSGSSSSGAELPVGIERALARAAQDLAFRQDLQERRGAAAQDVGIELTSAERAVLESIEAQQLDGMVARLEGRVVAPAAPDGAALSAMIPPVPAGIRPDDSMSFGIRPKTVRSAGIRPEYVSHGISPDMPPVQGSRPDVGGRRLGVPIALAAGAVVVGGAGALLCVTGSRPDEPPPPQPVEPVRGSDGSTGASDDVEGEPDAGDGGSSTETP